MLYVVLLIAIMQSVAMGKSQFAKFDYAYCKYAKYHYAN